MVVVASGRGVADAVCPPNKPVALAGDGMPDKDGGLKFSAPLNGGALATHGSPTTGWRAKATKDNIRVTAFAICGP